MNNVKVTKPTMSTASGKKVGSSKKTAPCRRKIPCAICQLAIVDGKDEALLCEANCQLWYHRGCASIPPHRYQELSTSDEPFVCLSCTVLDQRRKIAELTSTVTALQEELRKVSSMQEMKTVAINEEVSKLKQMLSEQSIASHSSGSEATSATHQAPSYASAAAATKSNYVRRGQGRRQTSAARSQSRHRNEKTSVGKSKPNLIKVVGARKVWGTLKACSPSTISNTISKLLPSGNTLQLRVKRKTKELGPKTVWWFVIHGPESDLLVMENEWEKVNIQTSWVVEPCYMPEQNSVPTAPPRESNSQTAMTNTTINAIAVPVLTDNNTTNPAPNNMQTQLSASTLSVITPTTPYSNTSQPEGSSDSFLESPSPATQTQ